MNPAINNLKNVNSKLKILNQIGKSEINLPLNFMSELQMLLNFDFRFSNLIFSF